MGATCTDSDGSVTGRGGPEAFDEFVRTQRVGLVWYAMLLTGSRTAGEDLVQEVLIRLYPRWDGIDDPLPYVRRSVTNEFLSWRRRWSTRHIEVAEPAQLDRPIDVVWDTGRDPDLWARLQVLPPQQRAAIVLRYYDDRSDREIAEALSCREGTVRAHISRGLATLRHTLSTSDEDGPR